MSSRPLEAASRRSRASAASTPSPRQDFARVLGDASITHVVIAGAVTSICIDSTGRAAYELGMQVSILSDCTAARTNVEQEFLLHHDLPRLCKRYAPRMRSSPTSAKERTDGGHWIDEQYRDGDDGYTT